jgi:hypothetical protein
LKCFGLSISQLTTPITSAEKSAMLLKDIVVPFDDRETETVYAVIVGVVSLSWISLQVILYIFILKI